MSKALIAEDDAFIREMASDYLKQAGFDVRGVADGEDGLALLNRDRNWDVLFADIRMPGAIDGIELAQIAKMLVPGLRVIYASGEVDGVAGMTQRETFLEKPYLYEDVKRALHAVHAVM